MGAATSSDCPAIPSTSGLQQAGGGPHFREQRRKRVTGFATLKRNL